MQRRNTVLAWIKENRSWLFSGVAVAIPLAIIGWVWFSGGDAQPPPPDNSVHQTHSGTGDTVAGDKNVINDNSIHQSNSGGGDNIGRDKIIKNYLLGSVDYRQLEQEIKDAEELLAGIAQDNIELRLKQAAKVKELKKRLEAFKEDVFHLHELFTRIPIDNERLRKAKEHFDKGEFREADAVLKAEEIQQDVERLKLEEQAAADRLAAVREGLEGRANEFLLKARLSRINPVQEGEDRFRRTEGYFEQALAAARTAEVLHDYALFLQKQNAFSRAEPLYQEALKLYRDLAEKEPDAFLPDMAGTLNNLAVLHKATGSYGPALAEYEEALKIYRGLARKEPDAFLPDVAVILYNLAALHYATKDYGPALTEYEEALKIRRDLTEKEPDAFLQNVATTLNNLANLHREIKDYGSALVEYEEALKIKRSLAAKEPRAFSQVLAETLLNLSIFHLEAVPDKAKSVAYAQEARDILKPLIRQAPHLQGHLDKAERLLAANKGKPTP